MYKVFRNDDKVVFYLFLSLPILKYKHIFIKIFNKSYGYFHYPGLINEKSVDNPRT